jgi:hypothetical protein
LLLTDFWGIVKSTPSGLLNVAFVGCFCEWDIETSVDWFVEVVRRKEHA